MSHRQEYSIDIGAYPPSETLEKHGKAYLEWEDISISTQICDNETFTKKYKTAAYLSLALSENIFNLESLGIMDLHKVERHFIDAPALYAVAKSNAGRFRLLSFSLDEEESKLRIYSAGDWVDILKDTLEEYYLRPLWKDKLSIFAKEQEREGWRLKVLDRITLEEVLSSEALDYERVFIEMYGDDDIILRVHKSDSEGVKVRYIRLKSEEGILKEVARTPYSKFVDAPFPIMRQDTELKPHDKLLYFERSEGGSRKYESTIISLNREDLSINRESKKFLLHINDGLLAFPVGDRVYLYLQRSPTRDSQDYTLQVVALDAISLEEVARSREIPFGQTKGLWSIHKSAVETGILDFGDVKLDMRTLKESGEKKHTNLTSS